MDKLRIFTTFEQKIESSKRKGKKRLKNEKRERPVKESLSASDIRSRVSKHFKKKSAAPIMTKKGQALGAGFMGGDYADGQKPLLKPSGVLKEKNPSEIKETKSKVVQENKDKIGDEALKEIDAEEGPVVGDIDKNDPTNPMTVEKLKTALGTGAFSFSEKEQSVLAEILK